MAPHRDNTPFDPLSDHLRGELLRPGESGYDDARTIWNAMVDRGPKAIARCVGTADVISAVDFCRERNLPFSVKSGGHHASGKAVRDDGLVIDLGPMSGVRVEPSAQRARVQPGATWGDIDHETQQFGLAVPGGQDPNIGVSGLTLGGGVGCLSSKYGLTSDNLISADVVTASGELVVASEESNPDLFWALRGGGGNFGIVTSFEFQLHEVGPEIYAGSLIFPIEEAAEIARQYRAFIADAPLEVRLLFGVMTLPAASYYPESVHDTRVAMLIAFYGGDPEDGRRVLGPLRAFGEPEMDSIRAREYTAFQRAGDSQGSMRTYLRSQYMKHLSDDAIQTILQYAVDAPSSGSTVFISPRRGAETSPSPGATAFPHRHAAHHLLIEARWEDAVRDQDHRRWVREFHDAMDRYTTDEVAMNFMTADEGPDRIKAAYGANHDRLVEVKKEWDPENLFDANQNIEPSG